MPPAFVLSQDQTLHKNYFNNFRCLTLFKRIDLARFLCVIWTTFKFNVNCQVTSHYSIFKQLSASQLIVYQPRFNSLPNCGVIFNLAQVWRLSNFVLNFFQTFLFQPRRPVEPNCGVGFNISQFWSLSNLISNFFEVFLQLRLATLSSVLRREV